MTEQDETPRGNGSKPVFDFTKVTRRWSSEWMRMAKDISLGETVAMMKPREDLSKEDELALMQEVAEVMERVVEAYATRDRLVCQVLVSVPRDWVGDEAPKKLDWSNPESLEWLKLGRFEALTAELQIQKNEVVRGLKN